MQKENSGEKRNKSLIKILLLIIALLAVAMTVIIAGAAANVKQVKYDSAKRLMDGGFYAEAEELLKEVGTFKDSSELIVECIENQRQTEEVPEKLAEEAATEEKERGSSPLFHVGESLVQATSVCEAEETESGKANVKSVSVKVEIVTGELYYDSVSECFGGVLLRDGSMKPYVASCRKCAVKLNDDDTDLGDSSTWKCESVTLIFDIPSDAAADDLALYVRTDGKSEKICGLEEIRRA